MKRKKIVLFVVAIVTILALSITAFASSYEVKSVKTVHVYKKTEFKKINENSHSLTHIYDVCNKITCTNGRKYYKKTGKTVNGATQVQAHNNVAGYCKCGHWNVRRTFSFIVDTFGWSPN